MAVHWWVRGEGSVWVCRKEGGRDGLDEVGAIGSEELRGGLVRSRGIVRCDRDGEKGGIRGLRFQRR